MQVYLLKTEKLHKNESAERAWVNPQIAILSNPQRTDHRLSDSLSLNVTTSMRLIKHIKLPGHDLIQKKNRLNLQWSCKSSLLFLTPGLLKQQSQKIHLQLLTSGRMLIKWSKQRIKGKSAIFGLMSNSLTDNHAEALISKHICSPLENKVKSHQVRNSSADVATLFTTE